MSYSNTQIEGQGHTITPPAEVTPVVPRTQRDSVDAVGAEYGALCESARSDALTGRIFSVDATLGGYPVVPVVPVVPDSIQGPA